MKVIEFLRSDKGTSVAVWSLMLAMAVLLAVAYAFGWDDAGHIGFYGVLWLAESVLWGIYEWQCHKARRHTMGERNDLR
ncbi:MAG: hypothetical protein HDQ88_07420 [Clostridia bacterium]|nr:hypothetical protein [Clostridia bacterium]